MSKSRLSKTPSPRTSAPPTPLSLVAGGLVLVLLMGAIIRFSLAVYQFPTTYSALLGMSLLGIIASLVLCALPRRRTLATVLVLVLAALLLMVSGPQLAYGARACWKTMVDFWSENTYFTVFYALPDTLSPIQHQAAVRTFLGAVFALLALPLGWSILRLRAFWLTFVLTLPWLLPAFLAEVELDWPSMLVICACWAALLLSNLAARGDPGSGARVTLLTLPVSLALLLGVSLVFPHTGYTQPGWAASLKEELMSLDWFSSSRWDGLPQVSSGIQSIVSTSGQTPRLAFSSAGPRQYTGRAILQVTTSQPGRIYLRGSIYRDYTGQAWTGVEPLSTENLTTFEPYISGTASATITHLTSLSSTPFLPYRTNLVNGLWTDPDDSLAFPIAQQEYDVSYTPLDGEEPSRQGIPTMSEQEEADTYLDVPEELSHPLQQWYTQARGELEDSGQAIQADATGEYAQELNTASLIAQVLARNATYDLSTPRTPSDQDFVTYFLQESHQGYCVHFATAATLLLRLQGIPARYVSGYTASVSPVSTSDDPSIYSARVLDSNEHAWVEIYLYGYGWYPIEVTPSPTNAQRPGQTEAPAVSVPPSAAPTPTPAPAASAAPTAAPDTPEANGAALLGPVLLIPLGVLVVLAGGLWLTRRLRARTWQKMHRSPDTNAAVLDAYRWFGQLERWGGKAGAETEDLARKARFSPHTLTQEERSLVLGQLRGEVLRLQRAAPPPKRWLLWLLFPVGRGRRAR